MRRPNFLYASAGLVPTLVSANIGNIRREIDDLDDPRIRARPALAIVNIVNIRARHRRPYPLNVTKSRTDWRLRSRLL
jgi:hypothetical protein